MNVPSEKTLAEKSLQELKELKFKEVKSDSGYIETLGITLNYGESVKSGTHFDFD